MRNVGHGVPMRLPDLLLLLIFTLSACSKRNKEYLVDQSPEPPVKRPRLGHHNEDEVLIKRWSDKLHVKIHTFTKVKIWPRAPKQSLKQ